MGTHRELLESLKARYERELLEIHKELAGLPNPRKVVHLVAILDKSGSMQSLTRETIAGYNKFIADQAKDSSTELLVTLAQFASPEQAYGIMVSKGDYTVLYRDLPIDRVPQLTRDTYRADGGSTALNDAIGETLQSFTLKEDEAYVFLLITDGLENASTKFTRENARALIDTFKAKGNVTFVFMGSHPDTWKEANAYGTSVGNTFTYTANAAGVTASYDLASRGVSTLRSSAATIGTLSTDHFVNAEPPKSPDTIP